MVTAATAQKCRYYFDDQNGYACELSGANFTTSNGKLSISGNHLSNMKDKDVLLLRAVNSKMWLLPTNIFDTFKSLTILDLQNVGLTSIVKSSLSDGKKLKELYLGFNQVTSLSSSIFEKSKDLETLGLNSNRISIIDLKAFTGLDSLKELKLNNNKITEIHADLMSPLSSLEILILNDNNITNIYRRSFNALKKLIVLNLNGNSINTMNEEFFNPLVKLENLHLQNNNLETFPNNIFATLKNLIFLDLSHNRFREINDNLFQSFAKLTSLNIGTNNLRTLKALPFSNLTNLRMFNFEYNLMFYAERDLFKSMKNLSEIRAQFNICISKNFVDIQNITSEVLPFFNECFDFDLITTTVGSTTSTTSHNTTTIPITSTTHNVTETTTPFISSTILRTTTTPETTTTLRTTTPEATTTPMTTTTQNTTTTPEITTTLRSTTVPSTTIVYNTTTTLLITTPRIPRPEVYCHFYIDSEFGYTCLLPFVTFLKDDDLFDITGIHHDNKSDKDVSGLRFDSSQLFKVPRLIIDQFPNLDFLDIQNTEMKLFDEQTFEICGHLKYLDASANKIRSITGEALSQCKELRSLNLDDNLITKIEPCNNFLSNLPNLTSLFMRLNLCINDLFLSNDLHANVSNIAFEKLFRCFSFWFLP